MFFISCFRVLFFQTAFLCRCIGGDWDRNFNISLASFFWVVSFFSFLKLHSPLFYSPNNIPLK